MPPTGRLSRSSRIAKAPRPSGPLPLILGIGGGLFLLVLVLGVASSPAKPKPPPPRAPEAPLPVPPATERGVEDTGIIMFVCANSAKHVDKEQLISECPFCPARGRFYWEEALQGFRCHSCKKPFPNDRIKCPDCGKVPAKVRTKHKPG